MFRSTMTVLARSSFALFMKENAAAVGAHGRGSSFRKIAKDFKALSPAKKAELQKRASRQPQSKNFRLYMAFDKKHRAAVAHMKARAQNKEIARLWKQHKATLRSKTSKKKKSVKAPKAVKKAAKSSKAGKKVKKILKAKKTSTKKVVAVKKQNKKLAKKQH